LAVRQNRSESIVTAVVCPLRRLGMVFPPNTDTII